MVSHLSNSQISALRSALELDNYPYSNYVNYYTLLASYGEDYGHLAKDVAASQGLSGRVARAFASARAKELEVNLTSSNWAAISSDLAHADFDARERLATGVDPRSAEISSIDLRVDVIRDYHATVFENYGLNITAWTAYVPLELSGDLSEQEEKWQELKQPGAWNEIVNGVWTAISVIADNDPTSELAPTILGHLGSGTAGRLATVIIDDETDDQNIDTWVRNIFLAGGSILGLNSAGEIHEFSINLPDGGVLIGGNGEPAIQWSEYLSGFGLSNDDDPDLSGTEEDDIIFGYSGNDHLDGNVGHDTLHGGLGDDILIGGAGNDILDGGEGADGVWFFVTGEDTADYSTSFSGVSLEYGTEPFGERLPAVAISDDGLGGKDILINIEKVILTENSDTIKLSGDVDSYDNLPESVDMKGSGVDFHQDEVDGSLSESGIYFNIGDGKLVGLNKKIDSGYFDLAAARIQAFFEPADISIRGANSVIGTNYSDILLSSSGSENSGEGYSSVYAGDGNDLLVGAGWESHLFGGAGDDQFAIGSNTHIEDAEVHDMVTMWGIPLRGGVKHSWAEGNQAYWAPFSSVMEAFPVVGASLLTTAAFFIDVVTMKFASYARNADGDLEIVIGWGLGGFAYLHDYSLDLDSGLASGGITVFQSEILENFSLENTKKYVNLALKAGFGVGLGGWDPLVLDLDGDGLELTTDQHSNVYFEYDDDGFGERTGWVRGDDGFLVLDANLNGIVDSLGELFGNSTTAGFVELATHDGNADGFINASDTVYTQLRVWQDHNQDGKTDAGELKTLAELGITSISLANAAPAEPSEIGENTIARLGTFTRNGQAQDIADVAFEIDQMRTRWFGDDTVSSAAAALPDILGHGELKDLRIAMTGNAALLALVDDFAANPTTDLSELKADAEAILYAWAGVAAVSADALGSNGFDERKLAFLEKYSGLELMPRNGSGDVQVTNLAEMEALWDDQVMRLTLRLVVQGPLADQFEGISYRQDYDLLVADTPTALGDVYTSLLEDLPSNPQAALAQWEEWAPLLGAMAEGMVRYDNNVVRDDFIAAQLLAAMDGIAQPLTFAQLAGALGIENLRIGTSGNDTLVRGSADGTAIYVSGGGNDTINAGGGQDVYIFGNTIGQVIINDSEGNPLGDRIRFAFLNPDQVALARDGDDLLITVSATSETIRISNQFADVVPLSSDVLLSANQGIEEIQFADGTIFEIPDIMIAVGKGTSGNDHLIGTMHSDALQGGLGNDRLEGGDDADLYVVNAGEGQDVIHDVQTTPLLRAADMLIFGDDIAPGDLGLSRAGTNGDDLLITIGTSGQSVLIEDQFTYTSIGYNHKWSPNSRVEAFGFREYGDGWSNRDVQQMLIAQSTTDGNDTALGFGDDDTFGASAGNDVMAGLDGADTYLWGAGVGNDVIDEQAQYIDVTVGLGGISLTVRADTVVFAPDLDPDDVVFSRLSSAPDLTVTITETGETLTVRNQFDGFQTGPLGAQWFDRIEWFEFGDGTRLSWQDVLLDVTTGGTGNDNLWGDLYHDTLTGGAGNDYLSGGGYADLYRFGVGDGQDVLEDNNDFILGSGFVTVDTTPDILRFGEGIAPADVSVEHVGADLVLKIDGSTDQVTLRNQDDYFHTGVFGAFNRDRIERVEFHDGTVWTWQDLNARAITNATTSGNDIIDGFMMADRFEASAGDDVMKGGDSGDTYIFGEGSGHDVIREGVSNIYYGDLDVVEFAAGIAPEDLELSRDGNDLIITITATGDTLTIENQFRYAAWFVWNDIEEFRFADGTVWTVEDVTGPLLEGTSGADTIIGFDSGDTLDGKQGNDILRGGNGGDTYVFAEGYGDDVIREGVDNTNVSDHDRLILMELNKADVTFSRENEDLIISINGTGDTIRIEKQFHLSTLYLWHDIEDFEFADGTLSARDVADILLEGTPGNDTLLGTSWADVLDGGAGNDMLKGGDGPDVYVYDIGYGNDTIEEYVSSPNVSDNDSLHFGPGIALEDLSFARSGNNLIITIDASGETLTILDQLTNQAWFTWRDVESFVFDDGTTLTQGDVQQILLTGTAGDDIIEGFAFADVLDGKAGNDILRGKDGPDTYHFGIGYGNDRIEEGVSDVNLGDFDKLIFGAGIAWDDLTFSRTGDDLIIGIEGHSDTVTIPGQLNTAGDTVGYTWRDVESFVFADGSIKTDGDVMLALLQSTDGDDHLIGYYTNDTFVGGKGNDLMEGGRGTDTYIHNVGDGHDIVADYVDYWGSANDTVKFGPGIDPEDVIVRRSSSAPADMVLEVLGGQGSVTLRNQITGGSEWIIERVVFDDGTVWDADGIASRLIGTGTAAADVMYGTNLAETLTGLGGNDEIRGYVGDDTIDGGDGNDTLDGGAGADTLYGGTGVDTLWGSSGNDRLEGGDGNDTLNGENDDDILIGGAGTDLLQGGTGNDIYRFNTGDGQDIIRDAGSSSGGADVIEFGTGIAPSDVTVALIDSGFDFLLTVAGSSDQISIDQAGSDPNNRIEQVKFADGTIWTAADLLTRATGATPGDDNLVGSQSADILAGGAGNDTIDGRGGNDTLTGGTGNDTLYGGEGNDTYVYDPGDGNDVIYDNSWPGSSDKLIFGAGIAPSDLVFARVPTDWKDVRITFANQAGSILINEQAARVGVEQVSFADGTVWDEATFLGHYVSAQQTAGNDTIWGTSLGETIDGGSGNDIIDGLEGNDTLKGGAGDDALYGNEGNDTYVYNSGDGNDVIYDNSWPGSSDKLIFGAGIAPSDLLFARVPTDWKDVRITFANQAGSILINEQAARVGVEQVSFADGTVWNEATFLGRYVAAQQTGGNDTIWGTSLGETIDGGSGNDIIDGLEGNDTLKGGTGDDTLYGNEGNDTYLYNLGDGNDVINDNSWDVPNGETLVLGTGITTANIRFSHVTTDLEDMKISFSGETGSILIEQQNGGFSGIEKIVFSDGTVWNEAAIVARYVADQATTGNDTIYGSTSGDVLIGGLGNDILIGNAGADIYRFALGDGQDTIRDAVTSWDSAVDIIEFGTGISPNAVKVTKASNGADLILEIIGTSDKITVVNTVTSSNWRVEQVKFANGVTWTHSDLLAMADNGNAPPAILPTTEAEAFLVETVGQTGSSAVVEADGEIVFSNPQAYDTHTASIVFVTASGATSGLPSNATLLQWLTLGVLQDQNGGALGSVPWSFAAADSRFDYLGDEETVTLTYAVRITDVDGAQVYQDVTVEISGTNDAPSALAARSDVSIIAPLSLVGNASKISANTYQLTPNAGEQNGAAWGRIDLGRDTVWTTRMFFGASDGGADGITFGLQNASAWELGSFGTMMANSLAIKFDTYVNSGEPSSDHSQIVLNGTSSTSFDPFHTHPNLENNQWHDVVVSWNAASSTLSYSLDGQFVASKSYDIVNSLFGGSPIAYYGFGARTGGSTNTHRVEVVSVNQAASQLSVVEGAAAGTVVGRLVGEDAEDTVTYSIVDAQGDAAVDSIFEIVGAELRVKTGVVIDYETATSHSLHVAAMDSDGEALVVPMTVAIQNVVDSNEAPSALRLVKSAATTSLSLVGSASHLGSGEYRLTPASGNQKGAAWGSIDLSSDVTWTTQMYFGSNDGGADGIAFSLQNAGTSQIGSGYGALTPSSLGIRFDTYVNSGEPNSDFAQVVLNNSPNSTFSAPRALANIENGQWHNVVIRWDASSHSLSYSLDGNEVGGKSYDVVDSLFGGSPLAYFGFGAATGGAVNDQRVKLTSVISSVSDPKLSEGTPQGTLVAILKGEDPNSADSLSYAIVDEDGDPAADTIFEILNGNELRIKTGAVIDADLDPQHELMVEVSDPLGLSYVQSFSWTIA